MISLQEGFYAYQFKRLGWALLCTFSIVTGLTGLVVALWSNRLWFFYAVTCITLHNAVDYAFSKFFPLKTQIMMLKPEATFEGFLAGSIACFLYFYITSKYIIELEWMKQSPLQISLMPFNREATETATGPLWESSLKHVDFGGKDIEFNASPA